MCGSVGDAIWSVVIPAVKALDALVYRKVPAVEVTRSALKLESYGG